jgi:hypothetical protein
MFVTDLDRKPVAGSPDWILVQNSPLSATEPAVTDFLKTGYDFVQTFEAFSPRGERLFDQQDMFFMPFAGFAGVHRPGPNFTLYRRSAGAS